MQGYHQYNEPFAGKGTRKWNINDSHHDLKDLALPARCALELIFRQFAGVPFKLEHLSKAANGRITPADLRAAIPELLRQQYIVSVCKAWGDRLYFIPQELLYLLQQYWIRPGLTPRSSCDVRLVKEAKRGLALDLFRSLVWIACNELPITAKGTIHQRVLTKLSQQIALRQEDVKGLALKYPHQDVYPEHIAIMLDMLLELNIINQGLKVWELNVHELGLWFNLDLAEMNEVLYQRVLLKFVPADTELQHFVFVLSSLEWLEGEWYSYERFITWLQEERLLRPEISEDRQNWMWSWVEAMCGFGWLELGCDHAGGHAFRWMYRPRGKGLSPSASAKPSEDGQTNIRFYIQPDFEIIVPPEVPFAVRWELEVFTESVVTDRLSIYRITNDSVAKGIRLGRSRADILCYLHRYSAGIPNNIASALEEWGSEKGKPGNEVIFPKLDSPTSGAWEQKGNLSEAVIPWGILFCGENMAACRLYDAIPEKAELFPGLEQIPGMWLKMARIYHPSTARQLVSQAIQWQTLLVLQICGEMVEYLPSRLEGGEDWRVSGKLFTPFDPEGYEAMLAPKDWENMYIQLPEIDNSLG
ncbi:hypothetical protein EIM92_13110 [Paenibacillus lentus]|uniref:Helicase XPB/Ssl2 N-terminal domain-containing protein n=1 Tax=Paenibacillus lentus TaxID=1338368 RepID=A0A3S8RVF0_9BACL|nr:hypothetical protein EIM92_13110 [Paenibacillus lentus]